MVDIDAFRDLPWFARAVIYPPTDPLTLQLLTFVEELPSLPGPEAVGCEHYSAIFDAFMQNGWCGFEEAFDRIFPRTRPDYVQLKSDLLREDIFRPKVHRAMTRDFVQHFDRNDIIEKITSQKLSRSTGRKGPKEIH